MGCIIKWITGISCPACGMTRAMLATLRLDFKMAFYYHPLFWLIPPAILFIIHMPKPLFGNKIFQNIFCITLLLIVLGVYIIRLFITKSDIITIDLSNGKMILLYKTIKEWFYDSAT